MSKSYLFMALFLIIIFIVSCTVTAHIEPRQGIFSLHVSSDTTGTVVDTGRHQITESGEYELIAGQPDVGYAFSYWKVVSGEENITILNKDSVKAKVTNARGEAEVKGIFTKEQLVLSVVTMPSLSADSIAVFPKPDGNGKYVYGTNVTVRIFPKTGWEITAWKGNVVVASSSVNLLIKNNENDTVLMSPMKVPANVICVKYDALQNGGGAVGSSWVDAYTDLNTALSAVTATRNLVWVARGTYRPSTISTPFTVQANTTLIGGFVGNESTATARDSVHNTTVLDGALSAVDIAAAIINLPTGSDNVVISTFTIRNSQGGTSLTTPNGGVFAYNANNVTIFRCVFLLNRMCYIDLVLQDTPIYDNLTYEALIKTLPHPDNNGKMDMAGRVKCVSIFIEYLMRQEVADHSRSETLNCPKSISQPIVQRMIKTNLKEELERIASKTGVVIPVFSI